MATVWGLRVLSVAANRLELLDRVELSTKGAEVCHGLTFILALAVAVICLALGQTSAAVWILVFNMALNGYPVMLQRSNRGRVQRVRWISPTTSRVEMGEGRGRGARE